MFPCLLVFSYVYFSLPVSPVYSCLPLFNHELLPMFTRFYLHLDLFTYVYPCLLVVTFVYLFVTV